MSDPTTGGPGSTGPGEREMDSMFQQAQRFAALWTEFAGKMASVGMAYDPSASPPEAAKALRSGVFQAMSQYAEEFMRSPEFLAMMKQSMDAAITFRKQVNDFLTSLHHNMQGIARQDIDSLMLSVRHLETRVLDRLEQITERMEQIDKRLSAMEAGRHGPSSDSPQSPPKAQKKGNRQREENANL